MALDVHWADQARSEIHYAVKKSDDDLIFSRIVLGLKDFLYSSDPDYKDMLPPQWSVLIQEAERIQQDDLNRSLLQSKEQRYEMTITFTEYVIDLLTNELDFFS